MDDPWPVRCAATGPAAAGTLLWTHRGYTWITCVAKAHARLAPGEVMRLGAPAPLFRRDRHEGGLPMRPLEAARETWPHLQKAEIMLRGLARAPRGSADGAPFRVRLTVERQGQPPLLDKVLVVTPRGREPVPVDHRHSFGGLGYPDNPLGVGAGLSREVAQIRYADDAEPSRPACFEAIPMTFPSRVKRAGDLRGTQLQQGHLEIPDDFDFSFFQAAPPDQRLDMLAGDEWIVLEGFHESGPFRTRLPGAQAEARIYGGQAQGLAETLALRLDMVQIDANSGVCALVWRGNFRAPAALDALGVGVTVSPPGQPAAWPATFEALVAAGGAGGGRADDGDDDSFGDDDPIGGTMRIRLDKAAPALPFRRSVPPNTPPPPPVRGQPEADDENPFEQTMTLEAFQRALPASPASPFQLAAPKAAAPAPPIPGSPWARQAAPASQARPVPGAPWSHEPATPVVARATPRTMLRGEAALGGVAPPAPVVAPPPVVAREHAASEQAQRAAEQQAKLEAERQAKVAAEEQARLAAEQQAKLAAEEKAMVEAEARRLEAAERFRKEQELAREAADRRVADAAKAKRDDAAKLRQAIYSSIRQRKK